MEMATIGGSQDERERWPQEYTTMPYMNTLTYTHTCRTIAGQEGQEQEQSRGRGSGRILVPGTCSGIGEQRTGQNCACNQFQVCAARGLFEKAIPLPPNFTTTAPFPMAISPFSPFPPTFRPPPPGPPLLVI